MVMKHLSPVAAEVVMDLPEERETMTLQQLAAGHVAAEVEVIAILLPVEDWRLRERKAMIPKTVRSLGPAEWIVRPQAMARTAR